MPQGGLIIPRFRTGLRRDARVAILEVHVPDALTKSPQQIGRRAAAVGRMPGVQAQSDERRIGPLHEGIDLLRRLDEGGAVMVKHAA